MSELLNAAQMRAIEAAAIASGEVTGLELMERAGRGVVEAIFEEWPDLKAGSFRAVVLCGPGNNGGDGFVVARVLKAWGWAVEVFLYGAPDKLPPDAKVNCERWRRMGEVARLSSIKDQPWKSDVNIDALFGTGLVRPLGGEVAALAAAWREEPPPGHDVAIDAPSGLCLDSGRRLGEALAAELTVTFHRAKAGHHLAEGPALCGKLVLKDIGLGAEGGDRPRAGGTRPPGRAVGRCPALPPGAAAQLIAPGRLLRLGKAEAHHKYSHGHALILSGPPGRGGAARLAARGCLRIGAGVVTLGCPPEAIMENAARLDAVMLRPVADAAALSAVLEDRRIGALCLGPGLGTGAREVGLVAVALGAPRRAVVLDADALAILAREPDLFAALHQDCVLTPHAGEFARLFPDIAEKLAAPATKGPAYSKVDATRAAAARAGCVVLYKGPDTVIADPHGRCSINSAHYERAAPWLATAGSGDVLAGFIAGLLARGFAPMQAAGTAAWLHVDCARKFGPGLIAEDLPEEVPAVFRDLGL